MKDRDLEDVLREELHRRVTPGEPTSRLFDHVSSLGGESPEPSGVGSLLRGRMAALGGLTLVALIAAVMVGGLYWRTANQANRSPAPARTLATLPAWQGSDVDVSSFHRLASGFAWVVGGTGQHGTLYTSPDDGASWSQVELPLGADFVTFTDPSHAFAVTSANAEVRGVTNSFLRSTDGGRTWTRSLIIDHSGFHPVSLDMVDAQHGWVMLMDIRPVSWLWRTTDGGLTWSPLVDNAKSVVSGTVAPPNVAPEPISVQFLSADEGWGFARDGELLHSLDSGKSWASVDLPKVPGTTISYSTIRRTGDARHLALYAFITSQAGNQATSSWVTLTSSDDGQSWTLGRAQDLGTGWSGLMDSDGNTLGFGSTADLRYSTPVAVSLLTPVNGLATFDTRGLAAFVVPAGSYAAMRSIAAYSPTEAWALIEACAPNSPPSIMSHFPRIQSCTRLVATFDAGKTWHPMLWNPSAAPTPSPTPALAPSCCQMNPVNENQRPREPMTDWLDSNNGWAVVGENLFWTSDGGGTWDSGNPLPASGTIQFLDREHGFLAASGSSNPGGPNYDRTQVFRTVDGGKTWTSSTLPTTASDANWTWAHFTNAQHGVVARCPQLIAGQQEAECQTFATDNGGASFTSTGSRQLPTPITWISLAVGWGIGYEMNSAQEQTGPPILYITSDGGRSWQSTTLALPAGVRGGWSEAMAMQLTSGGSGRLVMWFGGLGTNLSDSLLAGYETSDGGVSWHLAWQDSWHLAWQESASGWSINNIGNVRLTGDVLIGLDGTYFWRSTDFGRTWQQSGPEPVEVHDFTFTSPTTGWLVRAPGYGESPDALMKTTDGGLTWQVVIHAPTNVTNP